MTTPLTVESLLTTLEALAVQADQAAQARGHTWEGETLQALAWQVRRLVQTADQQLTP